jgi:hypothetical protein
MALTFKKPTQSQTTTPETAQTQTNPRNVDERGVVVVAGIRCHRLSAWARWLRGMTLTEIEATDVQGHCWRDAHSTVARAPVASNARDAQGWVSLQPVRPTSMRRDAHHASRRADRRRVYGGG